MYLVAGDWNAAFLDEAELYPGGPNKDQIDAAVGAFNHLALKPSPRRASASGGEGYESLDGPAPRVLAARELGRVQPPGVRMIR